MQLREEYEKRYFTIGETAELLQVNKSVLRFWETEFEALRPRKTQKGRRLYSQKDLATLRMIHYLLKVKKYTLQGAREKLQEDAQGIAYASRTRETLMQMREFLVALRDGMAPQAPSQD